MKDKHLFRLKWCALFMLIVLVAPMLCGFAKPPEPTGLIALLSDYGEKDFYVGTVKGVIYGIFPGARVVDISHDVTPFDVREGAVTLLLAARKFPAGTVFVGMVDPGVGTERRAIAVETENDQFFVGPDNGLFTLVMQEFGAREIREITNQEWMLTPVSDTFHGRDIFAPAAAHLARGEPLGDAGPFVQDPFWLSIRPARLEGDKLLGEVLLIDRYGNIQTNITREMFDRLGLAVGDGVSVQLGDQTINSRIQRTYGDAPEGESLVLVASTDFVEIAINMGSAAEEYGAEVGAPVIVQKGVGIAITPRIVRTPIMISTPTPSVTVPPVSECADDAAFVADVTVPDGTVFQPGERIDKTWRLRNSGTCDWGPGYRLAFVSGSQMDAPAYQAVSSTPAQGTADVQVTMYAPNAPGQYRGSWRMVDTAGTPFGQTMTIVIEVAGIPTPTYTPTYTPTPTPTSPPQAPVVDFRADKTTLASGECTHLRWDVENVTAIFLNGEGVVGHDSRQVCPASTTDYVLHVKYPGGEMDRVITIVVQPIAPPQPPTADIVPIDLFPDGLPRGKVFVRIINNGPDTLTNASAEFKCNAGGTPYAADQSPYSHLMPPQPISLNLGPGQIVDFDTTISIDTTQYQYQITCGVHATSFNDPNVNNDAYSEAIPPSP